MYLSYLYIERHHLAGELFGNTADACYFRIMFFVRQHGPKVACIRHRYPDWLVWIGAALRAITAAVGPTGDDYSSHCNILEDHERLRPSAGGIRPRFLRTFHR